VEYKDYYKTLGVAKEASAAEIQRAYRKLARQFHPDVNKDPGAEARFKDIGEAYEVLKDQEKRSRYDQYGAAWQRVQTGSAPPPGWEGFHFNFGGNEGFDFGGRGRGSGGASGFSSFFDMLFGGAGPQGFPGGGRPGSWTRPRRGRNHEVALPLSLENLAEGGPQGIEFLDRSTGRTRHLQVQVPKGVLPGQSIRLSGQGGKGMGAPDGDLLLKVEALPHPIFRRRGRDLHCDVPVAPWTAALGGKVRIPTLGGHAEARLPAGSSTGRKMRLRGRGLPDPKGASGDLLAEVQVVVPRVLTEKEQALFEQLRETSDFEPSGDASGTRNGER
jgi:curved DNA-binding protein